MDVALRALSLTTNDWPGVLAIWQDRRPPGCGASSNNLGAPVICIDARHARAVLSVALNLLFNQDPFPLHLLKLSRHEAPLPQSKRFDMTKTRSRP